MTPSINQRVYFLHWETIKSGIVKNIFKNRINLEVDFLAHSNLTLDESKIFDTVENLLNNLRNNYENTKIIR